MTGPLDSFEELPVPVLVRGELGAPWPAAPATGFVTREVFAPAPFASWVAAWDEPGRRTPTAPPPQPEPVVPPVLPKGWKKQKRKELVALVEAMAADWRTLNYIHNATATHRHWCSEYEERQTAYNARFKVLRLLGRDSALGVGDAQAGL